MPGKRIPIAERCERWVVKTDTCWLWVGSTNTVVAKTTWRHVA